MCFWDTKRYRAYQVLCVLTLVNDSETKVFISKIKQAWVFIEILGDMKLFIWNPILAAI